MQRKTRSGLSATQPLTFLEEESGLYELYDPFSHLYTSEKYLSGIIPIGQMIWLQSYEKTLKEGLFQINGLSLGQICKKWDE